MSDVVLKKEKLENIIKALESKMPKVKLGVLGDKTNRSSDNQKTNADIGKKHEFGEDGMPIRSFLRVPLMDNMQKYLDKAGAFNEEAIEKVISEGGFQAFAKKLGLVGLNIVLDGFETGGFGKWKPSNMSRKKNYQTLVETQQLRNSIADEVIE